MKKIIVMTKKYTAEYDTLQEAFEDLDDKECDCYDDDKELAESYYRLKCMIVKCMNNLGIKGKDSLKDYEDENGDYVFKDRG